MPTESRGLDRWLLWGLPATTLSVASMVALVAVFAALQLEPRLRTLFRIPVPEAVAALGALAAWVVTLAGGSRPGRVFPRLWALTLALLGTLVVPGALWPPLAKTSWVHALACAVLSAAAILVVRLVHIRPQSWLMRGAGALGLALVTASVILSSAVIAPWAIERREARVAVEVLALEARAAALRKLAEELPEAMIDPAAAEGVSRRVQAISSPGLPDLHLWREALVLGREEELAAAVASLLEVSGQVLADPRSPGLGGLGEPVVRWDRPGQRWVESANLVPASRAMGNVFLQLGEFMSSLGEGLAQWPEPVRATLEPVFQRERDRVLAGARSWRSSWSGGWLVERLPEELRGDPRGTDLASVLDHDLDPEHPARRASDPWDLMHLTVRDSRALAERSPDCQLRVYSEEGKAYRCLDCDAFEAAEGDAGARLRVEIRLVYEAPLTDQPLEGRWLPAEVYYLFPVPAGNRSTIYRSFVAKNLQDAFARRSAGHLYTRDRGAPVEEGFLLRWGGRVLAFSPAEDRPFLDGQRVIEVRGTWSGSEG
jgi:hypothetical protein